MNNIHMCVSDGSCSGWFTILLLYILETQNCKGSFGLVQSQRYLAISSLTTTKLVSIVSFFKAGKNFDFQNKISVELKQFLESEASSWFSLRPISLLSTMSLN